MADHFVGDGDCVDLGDVGIVVRVEQGCGSFVCVGNLAVEPFRTTMEGFVVVVLLRAFMLRVGAPQLLFGFRALAVTSLAHGRTR